LVANVFSVCVKDFTVRVFRNVICHTVMDMMVSSTPQNTAEAKAISQTAFKKRQKNCTAVRTAAKCEKQPHKQDERRWKREEVLQMPALRFFLEGYGGDRGAGLS